MKDERFAIRTRGKYFILEKYENNKVVRTWQLNPTKLGEIYDSLKEKEDIPLISPNENTANTSQTFAQSILPEPLKLNANKEQTDEEVISELQMHREALKKLGI